MLAGLSRVRPVHPMLRALFSSSDPRLRSQLWGLNFSNPVGIAAGLDKNGRTATTLLQMGWGHVEVGTVTPLPQPGNPRPRIFRLPQDRALINRMGFPGVGADAVVEALGVRRPADGIVGVNIGANKRSVDAGTAAADYVVALKRCYDVADYLTINVSSPNTARLRELQGKQALGALIGEIVAARDVMPIRKPLLVKLAPDLIPPEIDDILEVCRTGGVDGIVATNTTIGRPPTLQGIAAAETGGLSGLPLRDRATDIIRYIYRSTEGRVPIVGVGGVFTAADAFAKLAAGASLVQVYTGFIYEGPAIARRINRGLVRLMEQHDLGSIADVTGSEATVP
jgi:dihydroorotate dehydrogenase